MSKSVRPPKPPKIGRTRLLPPPNPPALKPMRIVGENGSAFGFVQDQQSLDDRGPLGRQLGPLQQAQGDQLPDGNWVGHQRVRNDIGVGRVQANRRIEIQDLAEPCRGRQAARIRPASSRPRVVAGPWRRGWRRHIDPGLSRRNRPSAWRSPVPPREPGCATARRPSDRSSSL